MFLVSVKQGHPTGARNRDGKTFTAAPTAMRMVSDAIRADPWLVVEDAKAEKPPLLSFAQALALDEAKEKGAQPVAPAQA